MKVLLRRAAGCLLAGILCGLPNPLVAGERGVLGWATLITNDWLGDGQDRWRTGSLSASLVFGPRWTGRLPARPGEVVELRFQAEVLAPERLRGRPNGDRPYAGVLRFGAHTHMERNGWEVTGGADLVVIGPQTGLDDVQDLLHDLSDGPAAPAPERQVSDATYLTGQAEVARPFALGRAVRARPFAEVQAGHETFARLGLDLTFGGIADASLMSRDPTAGIRYPVVAPPVATGWSAVVGGDVAMVSGSALFPGRTAAEPRRLRNRLRAGLHYDGGRGAFFAGFAWLGPEFEGQRSGQRVGMLSARFRF